MISDQDSLADFNIKLNRQTAAKLNRYWPGPFSLVLDNNDPQFEFLHRGTKTLAFRLPKSDHLRDLIKQTGPLVAPSANPAGRPPATTIKEAKAYFGDQVDFYYPSETEPVIGEPSTVIRLNQNGQEEILRS